MTSSPNQVDLDVSITFPSDGIDQFTACGLAQDVAIKIENVGAEVLTDIIVEIRLPDDFLYNGVTSGPATEINNTPIQLTLGNLAPQATLNFSISAQALCNALDLNTIELRFNYTGGQGSTIALSSPITVLETDLSIVEVSGNVPGATGAQAQLFGAYPGLTDTLSATIRNGGNGALSRFFYYVLDHPDMTLNQVVVCASGQPLTVVGTNADTTFFLIDENAIQNSTDGASPVDPLRFERNERLEICQIWTVNSCNFDQGAPPDIKHGVRNSCTNEFSNPCNDDIEFSGVNFSILQPKVEINIFTDGVPYPTCFEDNAAQMGFYLVNVGTGPVDSFAITLDHYGQRTYFDQSSFEYKIGSAGNYQEINEFILWNPTISACLQDLPNASNIGTEGARFGLTGLNLLPGDTLFVHYEVYTTPCDCPDPTFFDNCDSDNRFFHFYADLMVFDLCGNLTQNEGIPTKVEDGFNDWAEMTAYFFSFMEAPLQINDRDESTLITNVTDYDNTWLSNQGFGRSTHRDTYYFNGNECTDCYTEVEFILQAGLDWPDNPNNLGTTKIEWLDREGDRWLPDFIQYMDHNEGNDTLKVRWLGVPPEEFDGINQQTTIRMVHQADCSELPDNSCSPTIYTSNILKTIRFNYNPSCTNCGDGELLECQEQLEVNVYCPDFAGTDCPECEGIINTDLAAERVNLATSDPDNDGKPNIGAAYNESIIRRDRYTRGDSIQVDLNATVLLNQLSGLDYVEAEISFPDGEFTPLGGSLQLFRNGSLLETCNVLSQRIEGTKLITDLSVPQLTENGCNLPSNFQYIDGDSIALSVIYRSDSNFDGQELSVVQSGRIYAYPDANLSEILFCGPSRKFRLTQIGVQRDFGWFANNLNGVTGCNSGSVLYQGFVRLGGPAIDNFPGEYRGDIDLPTQLQTRIPDGFQFTRLRATIRKKDAPTVANQGSFIEGFPAFEDLAPGHPSITIAGDQLFFDPLAYLQANHGLDRYPFSDEGIQISYEAFYTPTCITPIGVDQEAPVAVMHQTDSKIFFTDSYTFEDTRNNIFYNGGAEIIIQPSTFNIEVDQTPVCLQIDLINAGISSADNVWFAFDNISNALQVQQITEITNGQQTPLSQNGFEIFQMGNLSNGQTRSFELCLFTNSCMPDSLLIYSGYDCFGYPNTLEESLCQEATTIYFAPLGASLALDVIHPNDQEPLLTDLCEPVEFVLDINSANLGYLYNIDLEFNLPEGMELVEGSLELAYPLATVPPGESAYITAPLQPVNTSGNNYLVDVSGNNETLANEGLIGTTAAGNENIVYLRFLADPACGFTSGSRSIFRATAEEACGNPVQAQSSTSSVIRGV